MKMVLMIMILVMMKKEKRVKKKVKLLWEQEHLLHMKKENLKWQRKLKKLKVSLILYSS